MLTMITAATTMSPLSAFLFLQGLETLPLRMDRHCSNTLAVANFLNDQYQLRKNPKMATKPRQFREN